MFYLLMAALLIGIIASLKLRGTSHSTETVGCYKIMSFKDGKTIFESCSKSKKGKVFIPSKITTIGFGAFSGCNMIEEVELNIECEVIGRNAFEHCVSLKSVIGKSSLEAIRETAFKGCKMLEKIYLGEKIKTIEAYAFLDCNNLKEIHLRTTFVPEVYESSFSDVDKKQCVLYVMPGTKEMFEKSPIWGMFKIVEE